MIDRETNTKLILDNPLPSGGTEPENLVASPDGNKLYLVHNSNDSIEILEYQGRSMLAYNGCLSMRDN